MNKLAGKRKEAEQNHSQDIQTRIGRERRRCEQGKKEVRRLQEENREAERVIGGVEEENRQIRELIAKLVLSKLQSSD